MKNEKGISGANMQREDGNGGAMGQLVAGLPQLAGDPAILGQIIEHLPLPVYTVSCEGLITACNRAAAKLWGPAAEADKVMWCGSVHLYTPEGRCIPHEQSAVAIAVRNGKPQTGIKAIGERRDGSRFSFTAHAMPLLDGTGAVVGGVNVLFDVIDGENSDITAHRLAAIVESSDDAIISKTLDGTITSWNAGAERIFGYAAGEIIGKSILSLIPPERHSEEDEIIRRLKNGERLQHFETVRLRKDGEFIPVSLTVSPIRRADGVIVGASKIARDITERKVKDDLLARQTAVLETLNQVAAVISLDLDLDRIVQSVTDIATELTGARFGAFFYNVTAPDGESYQLFTLSGAPRDAFESFGMPRNTAVFAPTFAGEGVVRSDDIRSDTRYGRNSPHRGMPQGHLPVVSYLAVPVKSTSGDVLGGLFFAHDEPGIFSEDTEALISAIASQTAVAMDNARLHKAAQAEVEQRRRAEGAKELLLHELKHRVKNTLATIQAIASQTFRQAPKEELSAFISRLLALSTAHDLLTEKDCEAVGVAHIVARALGPFLDRDRERVEIAGPAAAVPSAKALTLAMILHELATNAVKYGAWSNESGIVTIRWHITENEAKKVLRLEWSEAGGPRVFSPKEKGFGSRMIQRALRGEGDQAQFDFRADGLVFSMNIELVD
jgi:PAS domain S-box-containing protein